MNFGSILTITSIWCRLKHSTDCAVLFVLSFIKPKQTNTELKRKEIVLNAILLIVMSFLFIETILVIIPTFTHPHYEGISISFIFIVDIVFLTLFYLSRRGFIQTSSYILIFIYFLLTSYGSYRWGVDLPASLLSYALLTVISSILVSTRFGFIIAILIGSTIISLSILEATGIYVPHRTWQFSPFLIGDAFEYICIILVITCISWLSNREVEKALGRARESEQMLREERDSLEIIVVERTKELKQAQLEKVSELYRFVEFGKLAGGLFHDLMSPLTSLSVSVENLYKKGAVTDLSILKNIDVAIKSSSRMAKFIKGIRKKIQRNEAEAIFYIKEEIDQAIQFLSSKWKLGGICITTTVLNTITLYGNPVMFHHIMTNLISNAIDSFENTTRTKKKICIDTREDETYLKLTITDNGKGIPFEIISKIFEPFFTTKSHLGGNGIGLSASRHALSKYFQGVISVESQESKGTTFTVLITKRTYESKDYKEN